VRRASTSNFPPVIESATQIQRMYFEIPLAFVLLGFSGFGSLSPTYNGNMPTDLADPNGNNGMRHIQANHNIADYRGPDVARYPHEHIDNSSPYRSPSTSRSSSSPGQATFSPADSDVEMGGPIPELPRQRHNSYFRTHKPYAACIGVAAGSLVAADGFCQGHYKQGLYGAGISLSSAALARQSYLKHKGGLERKGIMGSRYGVTQAGSYVLQERDG